MIDPEDDGCGDADGGHEGVGASVVASVYATPVLDFAEHILDAVSLTIKRAIMRDWDFAIGF